MKEPFSRWLGPLEIHLLAEYLAIWLCDEEDRDEIRSLIGYFDELITQCVCGEWHESFCALIVY